jgi:Na+/H+ antiporter NhaD/arsenite permease-like protein
LTFHRCNSQANARSWILDGYLPFPTLISRAATGEVHIYALGIPVEFILFGLTLVGVAVFHRRTLQVALAGLVAVVVCKLAVEGIGSLGLHLQHEWVVLANLFLLLMGFAIVSRHFEESRLPDEMPAFLPDNWTGGLALLALILVLSSFLDNIAAALIGGTMARHVFRGKVHIGYLAAIVAASNAGGAGSVVGDTTTTMMWIDGVSPWSVVEAYAGAGAGFLLYGIPAALQQHRLSPIVKDAPRGLRIEWTSLAIVAAILIAAMAANIVANLRFPAVLEQAPVIGLAVWAVILAAAPLRRPDWTIMPETLRGTIFLLALVASASLMPVEKLPAASWPTALGLGFLSAVFDNIPLTALALRQGGYDWGFLAYGVGFGGSMIWFGSSAGVALSNMYPEAKSVGLWLRHGWHVTLAYVVGFFVMLALLGWHSDADHRKRAGGVHAGFVPVAFTTSAQVAMSFSMKAANCEGVPGSGMLARSSICLTMPGSRSSAVTSALMRATISSGTLAGAAMPDQPADA